MPTKVTGLKGYVAEEVVSRWLLRRYPPPTYEVVRQIIPVGCPRRGGGYLDFGVARGDVVTQVFEVKGQDYIFDRNSEVNKALAYLWQSPGTPMEFICQDQRKFMGVSETKAFLVLLVPPNPGGIEKIGRGNLQFVKLFQEIWTDLSQAEGEASVIDEIIRDIAQDVREVVSILKKPLQGKSLLQGFLTLRDGRT